MDEYYIWKMILAFHLRYEIIHQVIFYLIFLVPWMYMQIIKLALFLLY